MKEVSIMEKLYELEFKYTFEDLKKFNRALRKMQKARLLGIYICLAALAVTCILSIIFSHNYMRAIKVLIFVIAVFVIARLSNYMALKNSWTSNRSLQNSIVKYEFFEDSFSYITPSGTNTIKYENLYKILDTKTDIYLLISNRQGMVISKENCGNEFISFIDQIKNKYHI